MRRSNLDGDAIAAVVRVSVQVAEFVPGDFDVHVRLARQPQRIWKILKTDFGEGHIGRPLFELNVTVGRKQIAPHAEDLEVAFVHPQDSLRRHLHLFRPELHNGREPNLVRALSKCQYIRLA